LNTVSSLNISTIAGATAAIATADAALNHVAQTRADLGAIENRLEYSILNLMNVAEKTESARSRIADADFALESARLAKAQVLQQAGTSMLSQANQLNQLALELLRS
jgi:flagellin